MKLLALFVTILTVIGFGCGGGSDSFSDDSAIDTPDTNAKADGVELPLGTFRKNIGGGFPGLNLLVLKNDQTFYAEIKLNNCFAPPCVRSLNANYEFTKAGRTRYIRLYDDKGGNQTRFAYTFIDSILKLRDTNDSNGNWLSFQLDISTAWCKELADCEAQQLPSPRCMCTLACESNVCVFNEGVIKNPCEAAGGACVALVPDNCPDGEIGDAETYSCGGGVGVECCLPKASNPCEEAGGECVALVPDNCPDGEIGDAETYSCGGGVGVECCLPKLEGCSEDEDCRLFSSYCGNCECFALLTTEENPVCEEPLVQCLVDPCGMYTARCGEDGSCQLE